MKPLNLKEILELSVGSKLIIKSTTSTYHDKYLYCKLLNLTPKRIELAVEVLRGIESFHDIDLALIQGTVIHHRHCKEITEQIFLDNLGIDRIYSSRFGSENRENLGRGIRAKIPFTTILFPSAEQDVYARSILIHQIFTRILRAGEEYNNTNCAYNANSAHLKCAVNPKGSCDGCKDFKAKLSQQEQEDFKLIGNQILQVSHEADVRRAQSQELLRNAQSFQDLDGLCDVENVSGKSKAFQLISRKLNEPIFAENTQGSESP